MIMLVFNITVKVHVSILEGWLAWQQQEHIPAIMNAGSFEDYKLYRLLDQDESEGPTFVLQFYTQSPEGYQRYILESDPQLQRDALAKWGEGFVAFRTIMEELC
jgi:Domain of unknown function (DUF4286)